LPRYGVHVTLGRKRSEFEVVVSEIDVTPSQVERRGPNWTKQPLLGERSGQGSAYGSVTL